MAKLMWHRSREIGKINASPVLRLAMWAYSGETCQDCGRKIVTLADMVDTVWWPHEVGRIGHYRCYLRAMAKQQVTGPQRAGRPGVFGSNDMDRQQQVLMAADRMYDAIRSLLASRGPEAVRDAVRRLRAAADKYDAAMSEGNNEQVRA